VYEIIGKILYSGAGHRWQYGSWVLHARYLRLQIHTLRLCDTHCFSTATMVTRTGLNVTLYAQCLSCPQHICFEILSLRRLKPHMKG